MNSFFNHQLWIDGEWRDPLSGGSWPVHNPATGESLGVVPHAGEEDAEAAVEAASRAFPEWRDTPAPERAVLLMKIHNALKTHKEPLARLLAIENGKPLAQARGEVDYAASFYRWYSEQARRISGRQIPHPNAEILSWVELEPIGVVGAITPWNFPLAQGAKKMSAALAAGCTVVLKPAPDTPLLGIAMGWIVEQVGLPPGVMNIITGDAEAVAKVFYRSPEVRCISFTGSAKTGGLVAGRAAGAHKRVLLELGGNAPFVVLDDADLDDAVEQLISLKLLTNGQTCVTANRVFVQAAVAEVFTEKLRVAAAAVTMGNPLDDGVTLGPLINQAGVDKVARLVDDAISRGAQVLVGGAESLDPGLAAGTYYPMTLLSGVRNDWPIAQEEIFGPVLSVLTFETDEELISQANDTAYGLAGYVFGREGSRAKRIARALEVGIVGINDFRPLRAEVPFGGVKQSGEGREGGIEGLHDYVIAKTYSHRA